MCVGNTVPSGSVAFCEDGLPNHDSALLTSWLKNSEVLLDFLSEPQHTKLVVFIHRYPSLFGDVPSCSHVIVHNIDIKDAKPIKQLFYRVSPEKCKFLDYKID